MVSYVGEGPLADEGGGGVLALKGGADGVSVDFFLVLSPEEVAVEEERRPLAAVGDQEQLSA